jgi:hypothetical protein
MTYINNLPNINETFIIEPLLDTGQTGIISACTAVITNELLSCSGNTSISMSTGEIDINASVVPTTDATADLGTALKRFRQINTVSGNTTYWSFNSAGGNTLNINTIDLGYDSGGDHRILTADSSILLGDTLDAGNY